MSGEEFVLAIVAIVMGAAVLITGITTIGNLIKTWMKRGEGNHYGDEDFNRLGKAFIEHKKEMQRRVANLETIIAEEGDTAENFSQIELKNDGSSLTNDLQQKERVRQ